MAPATSGSGALSLAACAADAARVRAFDAVVVDEAQDFDRRDWDLVRAVAGRAPLWAFGDPGQRFWEERRFPEDTFPTTFKLRAQYRCPEKLAAFADLYREDAAEGAASKVAVSKDQGLDVIVLKSGETTERMVAGKIKPLCAALDRFTLHAATRAGALDVAGREALLRYVLRPPLAQDRLEIRDDGLVRIALKRAYADGTVAVDIRLRPKPRTRRNAQGRRTTRGPSFSRGRSPWTLSNVQRAKGG